MKEEQLLHSLKNIGVKPSGSLQKRISLVAEHLPSQSVQKLPLYVFRSGIILAAILLLAIIVSPGVIFASWISTPGSFLFPVKKAVIQTEIHFAHDPVKKQQLQNLLQENINSSSMSSIIHKAPTPTITATPSLTVTPTEKPKEKNQDKHGIRGITTIQLTQTPRQNQNGESINKNNKNHNSFTHGIVSFFQNLRGYKNKEN